MPRSFLAGTPFDSYVIPGLILGLVVGGTRLAAAVGIMARWSSALVLATVAGFGMIIWTFVELAHFWHTGIPAQFARDADPHRIRCLRFPVRDEGGHRRRHRGAHPGDDLVCISMRGQVMHLDHLGPTRYIGAEDSERALTVRQASTSGSRRLESASTIAFAGSDPYAAMW